MSHFGERAKPICLRHLLTLPLIAFSMYLISMYYKRYENQWRFNIFFSGAILAGSFSGLLAYAIAKMDGTAGYAGWRWVSGRRDV